MGRTNETDEWDGRMGRTNGTDEWGGRMGRKNGLYEWDGQSYEESMRKCQFLKERYLYNERWERRSCIALSESTYCDL